MAFEDDASAIAADTVIHFPANAYIITGAGTATIDSRIATLATRLYKGGTGKLVLTGDNYFAGTVDVNEGVLNIQRSTALGSPAGSTEVRQGTALELEQTSYGPVQVGLEALDVTGGGVGASAAYTDGQGVIRNVAGNNSWAGTVTIRGDQADFTALYDGWPVVNISTPVITVVRPATRSR